MDGSTAAGTDVRPGGFTARAMLLGERIDTRGLMPDERVADDPLAVRVGRGVGVVFRYGAVVLLEIDDDEAAAFLESLQPRISQPLASSETETIEVCVDPDQRETIRDGSVVLVDRAVERYQVVADVLSKSVVLANYEAQLADDFARVEPVAAQLHRYGGAKRRVSDLLQHIGEALLTELKIVGRVEVGDKPEIVWERPELERLYIRLADEFEIRERHRALERKLELVSRTAQTLLELLQHRHTLRVEWYIVILIVVEILLMLYQMFFFGTAH